MNMTSVRLVEYVKSPWGTELPLSAAADYFGYFAADSFPETHIPNLVRLYRVLIEDFNVSAADLHRAYIARCPSDQLHALVIRKFSAGTEDQRVLGKYHEYMNQKWTLDNQAEYIANDESSIPDDKDDE